MNILLELQEGESEIMAIHPGKLLKIKLEVDTDPPCGFAVESKYLLHPIPFAVRTYALPDLFAGKVHALLCRKWKNRVKGRDWYDFVWYCAHHPQLHMAHLEERMRQSGHWLEKEALDADYLSLRKQGAIALGYALSFSLYQLHILQRLVRLTGGSVPTGELNLDKLFGGEDNLKFG